MEKSTMGLDIQGEIDKVNGKDLSYNEFADNYLAKNRPVLLTGLMEDWRACRDWVTADGLPNLEFFSTHFAKSRVQVADCGTREFSDQKRVEMTVAEFIDHWINKDGLTEGSGESVLYLKDWHFVKEFPDYVPYKTPLFFCDDWLNLYLDHYHMHKDPDTYQDSNNISCSDYRFVYMGAKGSWTPFHADVFRSYSWSANVCGRKKWFFLSPDQSHLAFDRHVNELNLKTSVYDILDDVNDAKYPGFKKAVWLTCTQEKGEIIFVPSGWYHQVHNLEDTISINHNWFNGHNLSWVFDLLLRDYKEAKEYIEDIRDISDDFEGLCQRNLAANTGMNFVDFFVFLLRFFLANLVQVFHQQIDSKSSASTPSELTQHFTFNSSTIRKMAVKMEQSVDSLAGYPGFTTNLRETLDDPEFLKLCIDVGKTYGTIHDQKSSSSDASKYQINEIMDAASHILRTKGFVKFIDFALEKLSSKG
ncbi:Arginine-specific demethylase JMJ20 [Linum grandiflorum]